jgi:hypothetical protein
MLGCVVGSSVNEWRRRRRGRGRRPSTSAFASYFPDDYSTTPRVRGEATDAASKG